jgi:mono/diheme cytochrome c family protein
MSYLTYLHTHVFLVVSYTIIFVLKLAFLLYGADGRLQSFRRRTIWLEMIIPALFIFTGIMLALKSHQWTEHWFLAKLIVMLMVVFLGIQTFRRNSKSLGVFTLLLYIYLYAVSFQKTPMLKNQQQVLMEDRKKKKDSVLSESKEDQGYYLFISMGCEKCHGEEGNFGYAGATLLSESTLDEQGIKQVIVNGRKNMPAFGKYFTEEELSNLVTYVKSLRDIN